MPTPNLRAAGACLIATLAVTAKASAQDVLVRAGTIVLAPDVTLTDSELLIRDGKVAYVGDDIPGEARQNARLVEFGAATVSPGFVMAASTMRRDQDLGEGAFAFTPDLRVVEAFDPWQDELELLPALGVTAFGLSPSSRNVAGGIGAIAKPGGKQARVLRDEAFVAFSVNRNARNQERDPTSLMGSKRMLREAFEAARQGVEIGPDLAVLRQVLAGSRRAMIYADNYAELNVALDLAAEFGFAPVLLGAAEADKVLPKLSQHAAGVVLAALDPSDRLAELTLPSKLTAAGVPFCFSGRPDRLRLSAALAVRYGLDRTAARAALTRTPATLLGEQRELGALRQGCSADFVVFDGDLLDLSARHLATWVDGVAVHEAEATTPTRPSNGTR